MSVKTLSVEPVGEVSFYRKRKLKNIRLSFSHDGKLKVSLPPWVPYRVGIEFVKKNQQWIAEHKVRNHIELSNNSHIGKNHIIEIVERPVTKITTRVDKQLIKVVIPTQTDTNSQLVQAKIHAAALRALKLEAEVLLPQRLNHLSMKFNLPYDSLKIKQLKSRWGSCSQNNDITLNFFLMQLPWELIDYVILHELVHTKVMAHGTKFWSEFEKYLHNPKQYRKQINNYKPVLIAS